MISLNYRDSRPIYEQVRDGFRRLILTGTLKAGDRLPSVRELATELTINPNTIQRAYRELEAEGCIVSIAGKGSFVSESIGANTARRAELAERFDETAAELLLLGVGAAELIGRIKELEKKEADTK